ncbi:carbohydrate esterase family 3 protein, partial [Cercophora newfieldiana]
TVTMATKVGELTVMVVGDSISHGREGDFTWRYRIWEWFCQANIAVRFVGPYAGTVPPEEPTPPRPPPLASEPPSRGSFRSGGGYAKGVSPAFLHDNSHHFSASGRQAMQAKGLVAEQIAAFQPDLCLVQLGFNDLAWWVSGPRDTLGSIRTLVEQARSAKPNLKFAIANVPHRTFLSNHADLCAKTDEYNALLAKAVPGWSTTGSPVALVKFCENYSCGEHHSEAAYDGLHPNALGEYELAQAFSRTLLADFNLGHHELSIPATIPPRLVPTPSNLKATSAPSGVVVTWDAVYGAFWYDLRVRLAGFDDWTTCYVPSSRYDTTFCVNGQRWEYQVRTRAGDTVKSSWSAVVSAIARPETLPAPAHIVTHATSDGFLVSWDPPAEPRRVDRYGVLSHDSDISGAFPAIVGIKGSGGRVGGLVSGHHYDIAVQTWNAAGGGLPGGARAVRVGKGVPLPPMRLQISVIDKTTAELRWRGDPAAAGYRVWARGIERLARSFKERELSHVPATAAATKSESLVGKVLLTNLYPSVWDFEYAVSAYNGNDESDISQWIIAPPSVIENDSIRIGLDYTRDTEDADA